MLQPLRHWLPGAFVAVGFSLVSDSSLPFGDIWRDGVPGDAGCLLSFMVLDAGYVRSAD